MKSDKFTPHDRLIFSLDRTARKAIDEYSMIEENDHILIGFSGGKDSFALVDILSRRTRIFKPRFTLSAAHVVMDNIPYESDITAMQRFCNERNVNLHIVHTSFDAATDHRKSPCFLCSWNRRKTLFQTAKELGCNKIALGHHKDDILQTLLMNMTFQGAFGTMPPKLTMDNFDMTIIRPLCTIEEKQLLELCHYEQYSLQKKNCPYERQSHRSQMKRIVNELEILNPHAKANLWGAMGNIQSQYLPHKQSEENTASEAK